MLPVLPVTSVLPRISAALEAPGAVVVEAPPGAGKTTLVPLSLLDAPWLGGGRILLLEPRRVAARASARRMAQLLGEDVGGTVGYVTRDDRRTSARTRVEVVTEGVLTRRLQSDPSLAGVEVVLFDEFHERSLQADLGLALVLEVRDALRSDLRVGIMSATLDGERIARLTGGGCEVILAHGQRYPVETRWRPRPRRSAPIADDASAAVLEALDDEPEGDVLVFLPGVAAIRHTQRHLAESVGRDVVLAPLFGALRPDEQDRALAPTAPGLRKVVLATDIAETSLTIEGVRAVVDSGLAREPRFDPGTGMTRLETVPVSRASAEQRRGRAGRTAPGTCYRLWSEAEHEALAPHRTPEIAQVDLAGFALEVARWGARYPSELRLLDGPPRRAYERARGLLRQIGAVDDAGRITEHGVEVAALPTHPRLAHMIVTAHRSDEPGLIELACEIAALLAERDIMSTSTDRPSSDLSRRVDVLRGQHDPGSVHRGRLRRVRREADRLTAQASAGDRRREQPATPDHVGLLLAVAYPDRLAQRRDGERGRFLLSNGRGGRLPLGDPLVGEEFLVAADVDAGGGEARIQRAAAVDRADLDRVLAHRIERSEVVEWDDAAGDVTAERRTAIGAITLGRTPIDVRGDDRTIAALLEGVRREGLRLLGWDRAATDLRDRLAFLNRTFGDAWPDVSDAALEATLEDWLAPFLLAARRRVDLAAVPLVDALRARLDPGQLGLLDELAPSHAEVPSGSRIRLDYSSREVPVLPVRVQEMFGATTTPTVAGGRVPVLLRLLSPAHRPVQVTADLAGFWRRTYPEVRSDLRGRYPKHHWPEDPTRARPTRGTRHR